MINRTNADAAVAKYAQDNEGAGERAVDFALKEDHQVEAMWTTQTWDDGVPVTKTFNRNPRQDRAFLAGTRIHGVTYIGRSSGCHVLDFHHEGVWYSLTRSDACELLEDGGELPDGRNDADDFPPEFEGGGPFGFRR